MLRSVHRRLKLNCLKNKGLFLFGGELNNNLYVMKVDVWKDESVCVRSVCSEFLCSLGLNRTKPKINATRIIRPLVIVIMFQ